MRRFIKLTVFTASLTIVMLVKKDLTKTLNNSYNQCVEFIASNTINCTQILGV